MNITAERVYLACGSTDLRKSIDGLAALGAGLRTPSLCGLRLPIKVASARRLHSERLLSLLYM
jgi:hypothetical protein